MSSKSLRLSLFALVLFAACGPQEQAPSGQSDSQAPQAPPKAPAGLQGIETKWAQAFAAMKPYVETIPGTDVKFEMVPVPGGVFDMGSPETEPGRKKDEGPCRRVAVAPRWVGKCEVTWDEYDQWSSSLERERRPGSKEPSNDLDRQADAVTRPTPPYTEMTFGMGREGHPAICMTQLAATTYCEWLSAKTGKTYRLPSEAEWEHACRGNTTTAYSFGNDDKQLADYAWFAGNADNAYHKVGSKKPNPFGLHDMHGNVSEWVLDQMKVYEPDANGGILLHPLVPSTKLYPHVVRGGSWQDGAEMLRSAARRGSSLDWKRRDPQLPQSKWYFTDAQFVGFRVMRPMDE